MTSDGDATLQGELSSVAGDRLGTLEVVHSGARFLLLSADHPLTQQRVLLTLARPGVRDGAAQLDVMAGMLDACKRRALGTVIDRFNSPVGTSRPWAALATSWHPDSEQLSQAIIPRDGPRLNVLKVVRSLTAQLRAIHEAGYAHGDVSLANVLVGPRGDVHIVDFEYTTNEKFLFADQAFLTPGYSHPRRLAKLRSGRYDLADAQTWDRFALGRLILQVISDADPYQYKELTLYNRRALTLLGCLLLDGENEPAQLALGLSKAFFAAEKFTSLGPALRAMDRLLGRSGPQAQVPELWAVPERVVEIGALRPVAFTDRVRALVDTPEMQQLASCMQLGLVSFIWPTATHTRIEHAIGTFGMVCEAILNLYADPQSPIFKVLMDEQRTRALIASALLHDVGHYPLAHDLEEAYPKLFDHELRSVGFITSGRIQEILEAPQPEGWDVRAADVASIIRGAPLGGATLSAWACGMLHSIISSALDVDKLDYLVRDSRALSVAAGEGIDVERVLASLTIGVAPQQPTNRKGEELVLAVRAKGIRPAELVGRIRSHMFGVAYWHHAYRAIKAMVHWITWKSILSAGTPDRIAASAGRTAGQLFAALDSDVTEDFLPGFQLRPSSLIPQREGAVLARLAQGAGQDATEMLRLLEAKRWYKSVLTVEHFETIQTTDKERSLRDARLWKALAGVPKPPDRAMATRMGIARAIQSAVLDWIMTHDEGQTATVIEDWPTKKIDIQTRGPDLQLFLLDIVESRKAVEDPLYFTVLERRDSRSLSPMDPIPIRQSYDQRQLTDEFVVANGAIRLLVHPDFDEFVARAIPSRDLFDIVLGAVANEVAASKRK